MKRELNEQGKCWDNARILGLMGRQTGRRRSILKFSMFFLKRIKSSRGFLDQKPLSLLFL